MWTFEKSEKEGMVELISPSGLMVGYIFTDSIELILDSLNGDGE